MGDSGEAIRVLVVDDQKIVRLAVAHTLKSCAQITVSGAVDSAEAAYDWLAEHQVDVVILDIMLPKQSSVDACRYITQFHPSVKILILSTLSDSQSALNVLNAGANGYLTKDHMAAELTNAVMAVHQGEHFLQYNIARKLAAHPEKHKDVSSPFDKLSSREMDVAMLLIDGYPAADIADQLNINLSTVHSHRQRILEKLDVSSTIKLSHLAIKYGELEISICTNIDHSAFDDDAGYYLPT